MLRRGRKLFCASLVLLLGCKGMHQTGTTFTTHAESLRILGFSIPESDHTAAAGLVPDGAIITNVSTTPKDWSSLRGILSNLLWLHSTEIGGTKVR